MPLSCYAVNSDVFAITVGNLAVALGRDHHGPLSRLRRTWFGGGMAAAGRQGRCRQVGRGLRAADPGGGRAVLPHPDIQQAGGEPRPIFGPASGEIDMRDIVLNAALLVAATAQLGRAISRALTSVANAGRPGLELQGPSTWTAQLHVQPISRNTRAATRQALTPRRQGSSCIDTAAFRRATWATTSSGRPPCRRRSMPA